MMLGEGRVWPVLLHSGMRILISIGPVEGNHVWKDDADSLRQ
jgi:hypothetical protein